MGASCICSILSAFSSDLPGVNPATLNRMILYYRLTTKYSGLGDSMELSRLGLSQFVKTMNQCPPAKTKKMTKPKNKPTPKPWMV
jgi:hypothetical protein